MRTLELARTGVDSGPVVTGAAESLVEVCVGAVTCCAGNAVAISTSVNRVVAVVPEVVFMSASFISGRGPLNKKRSNKEKVHTGQRAEPARD